jgi:hypothetical protein
LSGASLLTVACGGASTTDPTTGDESTSTTETPDPDTTETNDPDVTTEDGPTSAETTSVDTDSTTTSTTTEVSDCGNGAIDGAEVCDGDALGDATCESEGFPNGGTLACAADCASFVTRRCTPGGQCGNDAVDGDEVCDGPDLDGEDCVSQGFEGGTLACDKNCGAFDTSDCQMCGDGSVDGAEVCDGIALGGQSCVTQGFDSGMLVCNADCATFDTAGCGECGNGVIDGTESCDGIEVNGATCIGSGYTSGTLSCAANCTGLDFTSCGTCGNGIIDGDELCDGAAIGSATCDDQGFDSGDLACAADCSAFVTDGCGQCGNGVRDGDEGCDGADLAGESCESLGLTGGDLACSAACTYEFTSCDIPGVPFGSDTGYNGFSLSPGVTTCDEISATGTSTGLTDDSNIEVPIGFSFPFYGTEFTNVNIQSNGVLRFGDDDYLSFTNSCLPSNTIPSTLNLYVFWDDLNPGAAGDVYYQVFGGPGSQRMVVQWEVPNFGGDTNDLMRFQAVLHEGTGQIDVCYVDTLNANNTGDNGAEATSGIQRDAADGFDFSCNAATLTNGTQLLYLPI